MGSLGESFALAAALIAGADTALVRVVVLSLQVSATACAIGCAVGLLIGCALAAARFRGLAVVVGLLNTLLALPSVVVGLLVYLLLSRAGPLGDWGLLFTPGAMVAAQAVLVTPLVAALVRRQVLDALAAGGDELRALGASRWQAALLMALHERRAMTTIALAAFGRAVSEVGAVMIVGGNIDGVTRVMTTSIALETSKGELAHALALGFVLLLVVALLNLLAGLLRAPARLRAGAAA